MGLHALSISPILVIDDNLFWEGLYKELKHETGCTNIKSYKSMWC